MSVFSSLDARLAVGLDTVEFETASQILDFLDAALGTALSLDMPGQMPRCLRAHSMFCS